MTRISQNDLLTLLASELDTARGQLEELGMALTMDTRTAMQHIRELQALDHVSQRCASVAGILRSADIHAATYAATLESITERLHRSLGGLPQLPPQTEASSGDVDWY